MVPGVGPDHRPRWFLAREAAALFGIGEDSLVSYLSDKQLLFIVDNCEHILAGASLARATIAFLPGRHRHCYQQRSVEPGRRADVPGAAAARS